jgi:hypothetical protein
MKRLIFLLLMAVLAVFAFAAVHPPGVSGDEAAVRNLVLAEYDAYEGIVTQPTVLVMPVKAEQSFQAVMALYIELAITPQFRLIINKNYPMSAVKDTVSSVVSKHLRC